MVPWEFLIILSYNSKTLPTYWTPLSLQFSPLCPPPVLGDRELVPWLLGVQFLLFLFYLSDPSLASRTPCLLLLLVFCVANQLHVKQFLTTFPTPTVVLPFGWPHPGSESKSPTPPSVWTLWCGGEMCGLQVRYLRSLLCHFPEKWSCENQVCPLLTVVVQTWIHAFCLILWSFWTFHIWNWSTPTFIKEHLWGTHIAW